MGRLEILHLFYFLFVILAENNIIMSKYTLRAFKVSIYMSVKKGRNSALNILNSCISKVTIVT